MIEFEGTILLATDAAGQMPITLDGPAGGVEAGARAALNGGAGVDSVLQDLSQPADDEWIPPLLTGASPDAITAFMLSPGEIVLLDPQSTEGEEEEPDIVVTGRRFSGRSYSWDGSEGSGSWGTGGGTGGGTNPSPIGVEPHTQDCGTEDGAAVQVARHVKGELPSDTSGPVDPVTTSSGNDWKTVEFGAVIVRNSDGSFGALNDMIYSSNQVLYAALPSSTGQPLQGIWHSHVTRGGPGQQAIDRYPSPGDWLALAEIGGRAGTVADPSLWITGPDGVTREFKLSEQTSVKSLSDDQMKAGEDLPGRERIQSCG